MKYDFKNLMERRLSVALDVNKPCGLPETYNGLLVANQKDHIELYLDQFGTNFLERIIISKKSIKSVWVYKD